MIKTKKIIESPLTTVVEAKRAGFYMFESRGIDSDHGVYCQQLQESRKTILMLGPLPPTIGGITTFIKGVTQSDLRKEYRFILYGTERPTVGILREVEDYTLIFRIGSARLARSMITTISHILRFPLALITYRPDIVHVNTASYWSFWENAAYLFTARLFSRKAVIHIHGGLFFEFYLDSSAIARFLMRRVLVSADKIIVLSPKLKYLMRSIVGLQTHLEEKIVIVGNFVDSSAFAKLKREMGSYRGSTNVLFVGGPGAKAKGLYDVLKAIPIVTSESKNVLFHLVACGNAGRSGNINTDKTFASHTEFLDYFSDDEKMKVFAEADIFILPSHFEGLPITMLEAMAAGLPVIATAVGSIPEVIEEGKNGFLIEVGDYRSLAEKILLLVGDKKLRLRMATNNVGKIREQYDQSVVLRRLGEVYDQILS